MAPEKEKDGEDHVDQKELEDVEKDILDEAKKEGAADVTKILESSGNKGKKKKKKRRKKQKTTAKKNKVVPGQTTANIFAGDTIGSQPKKRESGNIQLQRPFMRFLFIAISVFCVIDAGLGIYLAIRVKNSFFWQVG